MMKIAIAKQRGVALLVSLVILLVLTILGTQGMESTVLEGKMVSNFRDKKIAFEAAEAALKAGEVWLTDQALPPPVDATTNGVFVYAFGNVGSTSTFWQTHSSPSIGLNLPNLNSPPKFAIEYRGPMSSSGDGAQSAEAGNNRIEEISGRHAYRITARGVGSSANSEVILQSNVVKVL